jgi:hypothetical protein
VLEERPACQSADLILCDERYGLIQTETRSIMLHLFLMTTIVYFSSPAYHNHRNSNLVKKPTIKMTNLVIFINNNNHTTILPIFILF